MSYRDILYEVEDGIATRIESNYNITENHPGGGATFRFSLPAAGVPAPGVPAPGVPAPGVPAAGAPASGVPAADVPSDALRKAATT